MICLLTFYSNFIYFVLEITLVESDSSSKDDVLETKTYDLSGLELNKSYQHTFTFGKVFKSTHAKINCPESEPY